MPLLLDEVPVLERGGWGADEGRRLAIQAVDPLADPDWDDRVGNHPGSTFFHGAAWARVLRETYTFSPSYFMVLEGRSVRVLLPCMEVDTFPGGRRGVCLPFTDRVAPLVESAAQMPALFEAITAHGRARGWRTWESRGGHDQLPGASSSVEYYEHTLDLTPGPAALFCDFDPAVRRALRKAERSAIEVRVESSCEGMATYYDLHCRTRRKHGLPPQPWAFFANIQRHIIAEGQGRLLLAYHQERAVAGAVFFHWGKSALYKFGASDEAHQELRANNHVLWHAIESYAFDGFERLDLGRTSLSNTGLRRYKLGWGARESQLAYLKYDLRLGQFVSGRDVSEGWHNVFFRVMPLALLRAIGARLYRHLA